MSYQEKNTAVTLVSFSLILSYYLVNLLPRLEAGPLEPGPIYRLWITVVVLAILITYASGQLAALSAFSVLVAILIAAQIAGDATRLVLYRQES